MNKKIIYTSISFLFIVSLILFFIIKIQRSSELKVVFIDVGQGDSILISQGSRQILIDGGKDGKVLLEKLGKLIPFWDRNIEVVIETHPDADHIGGLIDVFRSYDVQSVIKTKVLSDSQTFKVLQEEIIKENSEVIEAIKDQKIVLGENAEIQILFPFSPVAENIKDTNSASVVAKLNFGENSFLFTGDLPGEQEKYLIEKNVNLQSDVLKVSHHGSKYSSTDDFLKAVKPRDAIISVGKNNSYGHPNSETLRRMIDDKINVFRTDEQGNITYKCQNPNSQCHIIAD